MTGVCWSRACHGIDLCDLVTFGHDLCHAFSQLTSTPRENLIPRERA